MSYSESIAGSGSMLSFCTYLKKFYLILPGSQTFFALFTTFIYLPVFTSGNKITSKFSVQNS